MKKLAFKFYDKNRKWLMDVQEILAKGVLVCEYEGRVWISLIENGTLIEYTGCTYANVDVYDGYLIQEISEYPELHIPPLEVYWDDKSASFMARSIDEEHLYKTPLPEKGFRVVGNIFEDTELFEDYKKLHKLLAEKE